MDLAPLYVGDNLFEEPLVGGILKLFFVTVALTEEGNWHKMLPISSSGPINNFHCLEWNLPLCPKTSFYCSTGCGGKEPGVKVISLMRGLWPGPCLVSLLGKSLKKFVLPFMW